MATPDQLEKSVKDLEKDLRRQAEKVAFLEGRLATPTPERWFKRNSYWFSPTIAVVTLVFGGGIGTSLFSTKVDERIRENLQKPLTDVQELRSSVDKLKVELDTYITVDTLRKIGDLTPKKFQDSLPAIDKAIKDAMQRKVAPPSEVAENLQKNFAVVPKDVPDYWRSVATFITYRSSANGVTLPVCDARVLNTRAISVVDTKTGETKQVYRVAGPNQAHDCLVDLDNLPAPVEKIMDVTFTHCLIKYSGGPIRVAHCTFTNCMFLFVLQTEPPQTAKRLIEAFLATGPNEVKI